jgi:hypothetical protein
MGLLYGRAGRLNTKNAGCRPGQYADIADDSVDSFKSMYLGVWESEAQSKLYRSQSTVYVWCARRCLNSPYTAPY